MSFVALNILSGTGVIKQNSAPPIFWSILSDIHCTVRF